MRNQLNFIATVTASLLAVSAQSTTNSSNGIGNIISLATTKTALSQSLAKDYLIRDLTHDTKSKLQVSQQVR